MRKKLIFSLMILYHIIGIAQNTDNPYSMFGYEPKISDINYSETDLFYLHNTDTTAFVQTLAFDIENGKVYLLNSNKLPHDTLLLEKETMARFTTPDPHAENYPNVSPYSFCLNNPLRYIDPDGRDVYMLFYTTGNNRGDEMFYASALTRQRDIMNNSSFNPAKDIVVLSAVSDLAGISGQVSSISQQYSDKYGPTAEFSIWSHAGLDGPTGTIATSANAVDGKQMSIDGWSQINFNWGENASANFFGCKTGVVPKVGSSFVTQLSAQKNFTDISVSGQTSSAYPSIYTNYRTNSDLGGGNFVNTKNGKTYFSQTYMVGGVGRSKDWNLNEQHIALPMRTSINGRGEVPANNYQVGIRRPKL